MAVSVGSKMFGVPRKGMKGNTLAGNQHQHMFQASPWIPPIRVEVCLNEGKILGHLLIKDGNTGPKRVTKNLNIGGVFRAFFEAS